LLKKIDIFNQFIKKIARMFVMEQKFY